MVEFNSNDAYSQQPDGTVIARGVVQEAVAGTFPGISADVEYIVEETSRLTIWSNTGFRGLVGQRICLVKRSGEIAVEVIPAAE